jgi:FkbM family methyltransferase
VEVPDKGALKARKPRESREQAGADRTNKLRTHTVRNLFGQSVKVFCSDHIGDRIAKKGLYERESLLFLLGVLRHLKAPVVLDVGANIGNHTLAFATVAHSVLAFEPLPDVFELLRRNVEANGLANVRAFNLALSDSSGEAEFFMVVDGNVGASSFERASDADCVIRVERECGDDLLARVGVDRVDFIKLDVEGHELNVLRGLQAMLQRCRPIITMEWSGRLAADRFMDSDIKRFLERHYSIFVLGSNYDREYWRGRRLGAIRRALTRVFKTKVVRLRQFDSEKHYSNLLMVPKGQELVLGS